MIVKIKIPHGRWVPGNMPDVTRQYAAELVSRGIAEIAEVQGRLDLPPKKAEEEKDQPIVVNNYFMSPGPDDTGDEGESPDDPGEKPRKKKKD